MHTPDGRSLSVGLIDPSAWLDRSRITNDENTHFLSGNFVNNATIEFPDYTLGIVGRNPQSGIQPELILILASSAGLADLPDRSHQDLLDLNADGRGAFLAVGAGWRRKQLSMQLGGWLRTDRHETLGGDHSESNYGIYAVFGWQRAGNAMNARIGLANRDVSVANRFLAIAYERDFSRALFGIGVARTGVADTFAQQELSDVTHAEVYVRFPLANGRGHISPSIQHGENPGFSRDAPAAKSSAFIAGLRLHWSF